MKRHQAGIIVVCSLLLGSCALRPTVPGTSVRWAQREAALLALPGWELRGRLALRTSAQSGQGRLRWRQQVDSGWLRVSGPFGAGAWELRWNEASATLVAGDGEQQVLNTGHDALSRLLEAQLGWQLPAEQARFWVLGIPAPGVPARQHFTADGWLSHIDQAGWRIVYADFRERDGYWMPRRLSIQRDSWGVAKW